MMPPMLYGPFTKLPWLNTRRMCDGCYDINVDLWEVQAWFMCQRCFINWININPHQVIVTLDWLREGVAQ